MCEILYASAVSCLTESEAGSFIVAADTSLNKLVACSPTHNVMYTLIVLCIQL